MAGGALGRFDAAKHPRGYGGKFGTVGAQWVGRIDSARRKRLEAEAIQEARKFLTGERRPEWYSPQKIREHGGRFNRDPQEAYESELDAQRRWAYIHPDTEKYTGDVQRQRMSPISRSRGEASRRFRRVHVGRKG